MRFTNLLGAILFPTYCVSCQKIGNFLCASCYEMVEFTIWPTKLKLEPLYLDSVTVSAQYQFPVTTLIQAMKYQHVKGIGTFLGRMLYYTTMIPHVDVITAVPLHWSKKIDRGFNQSEVMAQELSRLTRVPYQPLLRRPRYSTPQASVTHREQRLSHQQGVFQVLSQAEIATRCLIIDDVITTGSTLNEAAKVLKAAGWKEVHALAVAHGS